MRISISLINGQRAGFCFIIFVKKESFLLSLGVSDSWGRGVGSGMSLSDFEREVPEWSPSKGLCPYLRAGDGLGFAVLKLRLHEIEQKFLYFFFGGV